MADHASAARYRAAMEGFDAGDMTSWSDMIADDVEWWEIGADEPIRGKEALFASMGDMNAELVNLELHDVIANDDHLVALLRASAQRGDDELTYLTAEIYHLDEDGRVSERWAFSDDTATILEFFA